MAILICHLLPPFPSFCCLPHRSFPLSLSVSLCLNSVSCPLSLKHRLCQCGLADDYPCNHSHFRWCDKRKGLQIILTPPKSPELHLNKTEANNYFIFVLNDSRLENSLRKAQLKQCLSKPILPVSTAYFCVM